MKKLQVLLVLSLLLCCTFIFGRTSSMKKIIAPVQYSGCYPPTAYADLDINNVRTRIQNGGDWWWDFNTACYEIPKGSGKHSLFAGSIWIGGVDNMGQLKVAAMSYRQTGNDFWPGPLDTSAMSVISDSACEEYDNVYKVSRSQVDEFRQRYNDASYQIPNSILHWPGNGNTSRGEAKFLAPFVDLNNNGNYEPLLGDYPAYNYTGNQNCQFNLLGDQTIWWVINDQGNIHTETGGDKLGFEIQAQAFAYKTRDAINDMTFFQYKVINRSSYAVNQFYWGNWVDSDLGFYNDDYVGCDVLRGMGYAYNGDSIDGTGGPGEYGLHPPAVGFDFVGGPLADANDGIDNDRDSVIDEIGEQIKMSMFKFYNGDASVIGNPSGAQEVYYFLKGLWRDATPQTYGGNGHTTGLPCPFMFPGTSDPYGWGTNGIPQSPWDELNTPNVPSDRRFLMSAGPFTMQPGQVQFITTATPWARDTTGDNLDAIVKLQQADDLAQQIFDNCFQLPCTRPYAEINYSVNELSVHFAFPNTATSVLWNFGDGNTSTQNFPQHTYPSEGTYNVCLIVTNGCGSDTVCTSVFVQKSMELCGPSITRIEGQGNGTLTLDLTDATVNEILNSPQHRSLFPVYKQVKGPVMITVVDPLNIVEGQYTIKFDSLTAGARWKIYLNGSTDTVYSTTNIQAWEPQYISQWGLLVQIKQTVEPGTSTSVNNGYIESSMTFTDATNQWLTGLPDHDSHRQDNWIRSGKTSDQTGNACLGSFDDYLGLDDNEFYENMIGATWAPYRLSSASDISPSQCYLSGPAWSRSSLPLSQMKKLASVDLVITPDTSKWSRCAVIETGDDVSLSIGGARKGDLRRSPSVDKLGQPDNTGNGMGWFPGYAINLETGERLNIMFGEDSWLASENGRDMIWNPTSSVYDQADRPLFGGKHFIYIMGHNGNTSTDVPLYDSCSYIHTTLLGTPPNSAKNNVYKDAMWVSIPLLKQGSSLLSSEVKVRLRVSKPYAKYNTSVTPMNNDFPMYSFSINKSELSCFPYDGPTILFPNPFNDQALLQFQNPDGRSFQVKVYDYLGRLVQVYDNITEDKVIIRKNTLSKGVYIYSLITEGRNPLSGKFIVY